jgi:hypothetical protein
MHDYKPGIRKSWFSQKVKICFIYPFSPEQYSHYPHILHITLDKFVSANGIKSLFLFCFKFIFFKLTLTLIMVEVLKQLVISSGGQRC